MSRSSSWSAKRKEASQLLRPYARSSYYLAIPLVAIDLLLYVVFSASVMLASGIGWKIAASIALGVTISRMFVLGHDACHNSLTPSRRLNAWLGRLLFLPTMSCASLWIAGHNVRHHGFAGLRGRDVPWVPLSPEQYEALPAARRRLYRIYRSWWGAGIYYGLDIWWRQQYFPKGKVRPIFLWDSWLVTAFMLAQVAAYSLAARATEQSTTQLMLFGIVLPFVIWLYMAGIVFYLHHTEKTARWYDDVNEWRAAQPDLESTHDIRLSLRIDLLLHHALEHTAHHVNAAIPCYRLSDAQRELRKRWPSEVPTRIVTPRRYLAITRTCQLYDARNHKWVSFTEIEKPSARIAGPNAVQDLSSGNLT